MKRTSWWTSLILATAVSLPAVAQTTRVTSSDGRYLPDHTWVRVLTVGTQRHVPRRFTDCSQVDALTHPVGRRASGIVFGGEIFYFGGGGGSHPGNDVELFDVNGNAWVQQYQPECVPECCCTSTPLMCDVLSTCSDACRIPGGTGTDEVTPLGRPYTEHAYQLVAYNPLRGTFTAAFTSGLWEWDAATTEWSHLTTDRPESTGIETKLLVFDPDLQTVLYLATTQVNHTVFRFDYGSAMWTPHGSIPEEIAWAEIYSAYDSDEHKHLVSHGSGTFWVYDAVASTWTRLQDVPPRASLASFLAYDPLNRAFLVGKKDNTNTVRLWTYALSTNTWTELHPEGQAPTTPVPGLANNLVYDPVWKRFYYLNVRAVSNFGEGGTGEGDVETWALRLGNSLGPGDVNCDGGLTAADVTGLITAMTSGSASDCAAVDVNRDARIDAQDVSIAADAIFAIPF